MHGSGVEILLGHGMDTRKDTGMASAVSVGIAI